MRSLAYLLGLSAGFGLSVQIGMNSQLRRSLHGAYPAALLLMLLVTRTPLPSRDTLASIPLWAWFGGLFGAFYVAISTIVAAELGASSLLALAIAGQLLMALVIDHFGWLGLPVNPVTWARMAGVVLLGAGVWLIAR
jgi:transporter family-2 protein